MFYFSNIYIYYFFELKVYTCVSDAVISKFIPTSTPKFQFYNENVISYVQFAELANKLSSLKQQVCTYKWMIVHIDI